MLNKKDIALNLIGEKSPELICIVGPTASGKSDLAIEIAKELSAKKEKLQLLTLMHIHYTKKWISELQRLYAKKGNY